MDRVFLQILTLVEPSRSTDEYFHPPVSFLIRPHTLKPLTASSCEPRTKDVTSDIYWHHRIRLSSGSGVHWISLAADRLSYLIYWCFPVPFLYQQKTMTFLLFHPFEMIGPSHLCQFWSSTNSLSSTRSSLHRWCEKHQELFLMVERCYMKGSGVLWVWLALHQALVKCTWRNLVDFSLHGRKM